jgi:signal transduction histidine kinase
MSNLIMSSLHPAAMYWGEHLVTLYNEPYIELAGQKHPGLMGQSYPVGWQEIWSDVAVAFAKAKYAGKATMKHDDKLFLTRATYNEETYFEWSIIPITGANGEVCGLYNPAFEKTRSKISDRRMQTLRALGEQTAYVKDVKSFWKAVESALDTNHLDTPFVLLYSVAKETPSEGGAPGKDPTPGVRKTSGEGTTPAEDTAADGDKTAGEDKAAGADKTPGKDETLGKQSRVTPDADVLKLCRLEGSLGVPVPHSCSPERINLKSGDEGFGSHFRSALQSATPILLRVVGPELEGKVSQSYWQDEALEEPAIPITSEVHLSMLQGIQWRGHDNPCRFVVVLPVRPTVGNGKMEPLGFVVLGINPQRPYDTDYHLFIQLLGRQLGTSLASTMLFEAEIRRGQEAVEAAAKDKIQLTRRLADVSQEARDMESRFMRMADMSPAGLFMGGTIGSITYCNDTFYEISGIPPKLQYAKRWMDYVAKPDAETVQNMWAKLIHHFEPVTAEIRFNAPWTGEDGTVSERWVLFSAQPEVRTTSEGAKLVSVFSAITNISPQKWATGIQRLKTEEAVELKRQQERFIDITSHEMRNPLSAMLHCSEQISKTLGALDPDRPSREGIESCTDAAQTIFHCAQHQRRIVDDILNLSKLDSQKITITPVDVRPRDLLQKAVKMFELEVKTAEIELKVAVDDSIDSLQVDWTRLDPHRISQVLINLMSNAIKFSSHTGKENGSINVRMGAALTRPSASPNSLVDYFPPRTKETPGLLTAADWGEGEELFLEFVVQDTGPGLADEERRLLFNKFTQASPKTHVQYGGSGLGLFISRELTELQGGEIGLASNPGEGSTFAFYVRCRRSKKPRDEDSANLVSPPPKLMRGEGSKDGKMNILLVEVSPLVVVTITSLTLNRIT